MSSNSVKIQGTLQPDGTLLDEKPNLPPGRVQVTVQPVLDYTQTDLWRFFEQLRAAQQASGFVPRSKEEIDADVAAMRDKDGERTQDLERLQEECRRLRELRWSAEGAFVP